MVETISPVVYGTRARWIGSLALHAAGAAATAAAFGAAVAAAGALLGAPWGRAGAVVLVTIAILYAARELLGLRVPVPQLRRQVPDWWRTFFGRPVAVFLYGAGLGVGFLTYLGHGTLVVVALGAAASGRPAIGAVAMAPFGLARGIAPLVAARSRVPEDGRRLVDRLGSMDDRIRSLANAAAILLVATIAAAGGITLHGGWDRAASAGLAVAFGWAAISKVVGAHPWRRGLPAYVLPARIEGVAGWAVPPVETLVPALALLGRDRAAAGLAIAALAVFSTALVRAARLHGIRVPCGCFGRTVVDVRAALARNAALVALAVVVSIGAPPDPPLTAPSGLDLVPAILAAGSLVVAALTAWRAASWLSRGNA